MPGAASAAHAVRIAGVTAKAAVGTATAPTGQPAIGQRRAHVMQQQIGIRADGLIRCLRKCVEVACFQFGYMAHRAACPGKKRFALQNLRVIDVAACRY